MRNPERIEPILNELKTLWLKYPDLRLGQLICGFGVTSYNDNPFYVEDEQLLENIKRMLEE